jgi:hypothetical protein
VNGEPNGEVRCRGLGENDRPWHAALARQERTFLIDYAAFGGFGHGNALSTPRFVSNQSSLLFRFLFVFIDTVFTVQILQALQSVKPFLAALSNDILIFEIPAPSTWLSSRVVSLSFSYSFFFP